MTARLRRLSSRELIRALRDLGSEVVRVRGSHAKLARSVAGRGRQTLTIPLHDEIALGTLRAIHRQLLRYVSREEARQVFYSE